MFATTLIRVAVGFVFFYFGFLKFFPALSPAEHLASITISELTFGLLNTSASMMILGAFECLLGLTFLFGIWVRWSILLYFFHMACTFSPLLMFPELTFKIFPYVPTLEGQYILKNLIILAALYQIFSYEKSKLKKVPATV